MTVQLEYINNLLQYYYSKIFPIMLALCSVLSVTYYRTVGNFLESNFSWFGSLEDFAGLYFHGVLPLTIAKIQ